MIFGALDASASGLTAEQLRMDVIAENLANVDTTVTAQGGPYRRQMVEFAPIPLSGTTPGGVAVVAIVPDGSPFPQRYDPGSPLANAQGMVRMPNVSVTAEMVDLLAASRAYAASASAFSDFVKQAERTLQL